MKIKLNGIEFDVAAVDARTREAILGDPVIARAVWRDVYVWDATAQEGKHTGPVTQTGAIPLANGISFYVPKGDGPAKNESASKTSGERFLKALGVSSTLDVLKAMAMGAKGTYIGRAFIYGLGAMGQAGVTSALEVIHKELDLSMALCGETSVAGLGKHNLLIPKGFEGDWQP